MNRYVLLSAGLLSLSACNRSADTQTAGRQSDSTISADSGAAPVTRLVYAGTLPCRPGDPADCAGLQTELTLNIDPVRARPTYLLRQTYADRPAAAPAAEEGGVYTTLRGTAQNPDATIYQLAPGKPERRLYLLRINDDTLRLLDANQHELKTGQNVFLVRTAPN